MRQGDIPLIPTFFIPRAENKTKDFLYLTVVSNKVVFMP